MPQFVNDGKYARRMTKRELRRARGQRGVVATAAPAKKVPSRELVGDLALLAAVAEAKKERDAAEAAVRRHVRSARRAGVSWARIGEALGVTKQSVMGKYGPYPESKVNPPARQAAPR